MGENEHLLTQDNKTAKKTNCSKNKKKRKDKKKNITTVIVQESNYPSKTSFPRIITFLAHYSLLGRKDPKPRGE